MDGALEMKKLIKERADICIDRAIDYIWQLGACPAHYAVLSFRFSTFHAAIETKAPFQWSFGVGLLQDNQKPLPAGTFFSMYSLILDVKYAVRR